MASTKRNMNWKSVVFTPTGGSACTFTGTTNVSFDPGGNLLEFSGDMDHFHTTTVCDFMDWSAQITTADITAALTNGPGAVGQLVAVHNDAKNLVTPWNGQITYTLSNAIIQNTPTQGAHRAFGSATVSLKSYSSDGATSPMAIVTA